MSIALDIGSSHLRSLRHENGRLKARTCRSLFAVMPDSESRRHVLGETGISYAICEDELVLMGNGAEEFSRLFQVPPMALLPNGKLRPDDPPSRQILACLIEALLPHPQFEGELCCMTLPGLPPRHSAMPHSELEFFSRVVSLRGYQPMVLSAGMATIVAHLVDEGFTGIGIDFGAETCEVSLAHRGMEVVRTAVPRGGNYIDEQLAVSHKRYAWDSAGNKYLDIQGANRWKEEISGSIMEPDNSAESDLARLYRELVSAVIGEAAHNLSRSPQLETLPWPMPVVCTGGVAQISGFQSMMEEMWRKVPFPIEISGIDIVTGQSDSETANIAMHAHFHVARGCLINAHLETETRSKENEAAIAA